MEGAWNVFAGFLAVVAMMVFWAVVIFVIPTVFALYVSTLFPLTGQWRKRWRARKRKDTEP